MFNSLAFVSTDSSHGTGSYADVERESGRRRVKRWEKHFIICQDVRTGGSFLFHQCIEPAERYSPVLFALSCSVHIRPLRCSSLSRDTGDPHQHTLICTQVPRERCSVWAWSRELTGSRRSRSEPWPFIISILCTACLLYTSDAADDRYVV